SAGTPARAPNWRPALPGTGSSPRRRPRAKAGSSPGTGPSSPNPRARGRRVPPPCPARQKGAGAWGGSPPQMPPTPGAAQILRQHGVHAATDVTGFGLIGHLIEMVRASDVDATLAIDRLPLLEGARETVARGIFSSLQPQNVRLRRAIRELATVAEHPLYPMLFDPQTSGGLLAAVPLAQAAPCVHRLRPGRDSAPEILRVVAERSDA